MVLSDTTLTTSIEAAADRIRPYVRTTPCLELEAGAFGLPGHIVLKLEQLQHTGSFKPRGAFNRLLSNLVPESGVIAASGGNHGAAVAYAARALDYKARIFVPEVAASVKVERLRAYGAEVHVVGATYAEALEASRELAATTGALVAHAYDQPETIFGQGTLGRELEHQVRALDSVLVAVGGGGLIGGIAGWLQRRARVVAVEPERIPTLARALEAGAPVEVDVGGVAADSLGARRIGALMFPIAQRHVHAALLVSDEAIIEAQRALWDHLRIVTEPAGATAFAALLCGAYRPEPDERVGVILCGANTDPASVA